MDANGLRFWNLSARNHWAQSSIAAVAFDESRYLMRLSSERALPAPADDLTVFAEASSRLERVPAALDVFGTFAYWDSATRTVRAAGAGPGTTAIFTPAAGDQPSDIAIGYDGVLYIAIAGGVTSGGSAAALQHAQCVARGIQSMAARRRPGRRRMGARPYCAEMRAPDGLAVARASLRRVRGADGTPVS
jgi:hypothetical protein